MMIQKRKEISDTAEDSFTKLYKITHTRTERTNFVIRMGLNQLKINKFNCKGNAEN